MSFRPGLLASTSRALTPTATVRLQYAVRQYASASSTTAPKLETKKNITIQETDKKIKEQQRAVRRMPVHIDVATFYDKVIFGEWRIVVVGSAPCPAGVLGLGQEM